jgi:potassium/hydrogen antiporter
MAEGHLILVAGALLSAALLASLLAGRLRVPGLVLFLGVGMAVGSDGLGWLDFDDYRLARDIGVVALALILFEGGLSAGWDRILPVLGAGASLALLGTLVTAAIAGLAATALFGFGTLEGLLLGAIVASTDGAAIFGLLRASALRARLAHVLEAEAGFNDPVAVLLVLGFIAWIQQPGYGVGDMAWLLVRQLGIGLGVGLAVGAVGVQAFRRVRLQTAGLYPVASVAIAALAYGAAASLHGSGFLAVYLAGLALGGATVPAKRTVLAFHDGLAWVAQLTMFVVLGLLVFPGQLGAVALKGTALALILVLVARPLATVVATAPIRFGAAERAVLAWAGLRGAVPVVLATFPVIAGVRHSLEFFNVVFFAVVLSTLLQGSTFESLARRLGMTSPAPPQPSPIAEGATIRSLGAEVLEYAVEAGDAAAGARVRELGLPRDALVNLIVRHGEAIPPRGSTRLETGDRLHVLVRREAAAAMPGLATRWREGPLPRPRRRQPAVAGRVPVFHVRPWRRADGDPGAPRAVNGHDVLEHLRSRRDLRGALVLLDDGRFAVTGPQLALGGRELLAQWVRGRAARAAGDSERGWWEEVLGALAL